MVVIAHILKCRHCSHIWIRRRQKTENPKVCPNCKSRRWKFPPIKKHIPKTRIKKPAQGILDELNQGQTALAILSRRYLLRDQYGSIIETPRQLFRRVANHIAQADKNYNQDCRKIQEEFYSLLANFEFMPNSPTLMNANTSLGQLSACFVLPLEDSIESIFTTLKNLALIEQTGGGVGINFSKLRPKGDIVRSTAGVASGPVSFARIFDTTTEVIKSGGKRRGAMMGMLDITHPDIKEFIRAKSKENLLTNFNLSVSLTEEFMQNLKQDRDYWLINPRNNKKTEKVSSKEIFNLLAENACKHGDPGIIFIDEINLHNPMPKQRITTTNPCSEQPLPDYGSCNLGSINLNKIIKNNSIDWSRLSRIIHKAVHFLDNVIDVNKYPIREIEKVAKQNRPIGLGIMGWADLLIKLKIPYNSEQAVILAKKIMKFISEQAKQASINLAKRRGAFPDIKKSIYRQKIRNSTRTTIAPTGTISIISNCSSAIEPLFAVAYIRKILDTEFIEINQEFEKIAKQRGFYSKELIKKIIKTGSIQDIREIPKDIKKTFVTALDIEPEWHVKMQAAFQKYVDSSISKTVNLKKNATIDDVKKIFLLAHRLKCKGIAVYRYGSKKQQVLNIGKTIKVKSEYSGGCPYRKCLF